ncbi:hypothetical protein [Azospirillum halopraeferens]|uniref:hypothetical protein n=1 Tax=Azospirillum halopraeferens TaxID=34010 RepID=UPI00041EF662|nr:hypothetical protein [Azospirillum halopraeferens]
MDAGRVAVREPPESAIDRIEAGRATAADLDPLSEGFLLKHQRNWIADPAPLKIAPKGRRTGMTFAEAHDHVLIAAASREAGGDHCWYIGDTAEKGREFITTCANFAQTVANELCAIEDFVFDDQEEQPDGTVKTRQITAWRIRFASGHRITGLSSRPAAIRGLQGVVVIDEAAFHADVGKVLEAVLALLIWGGKVRIISSHNGATNAFNTLCKEAESGKFPASIHHVPFDVAVTNGLYERVCLARGWTPSVAGKRAWYNQIRAAYGTRTAAMREELDAIPREDSGTMLALALIEAAMTPDYTVVRWEKPAPDADGREFVDWPEARRRAHMAAWIEAHVQPALDRLPSRWTYGIGGDFAMRQDRSAYAVAFADQQLARHVPLLVEARECPYDQQKQMLWHIADFLRSKRRLGSGVLDAGGNGMVLAQEARQRYGAERIVELIATDAWLRVHSTQLKTAFEDRTIRIGADLDVRDDLHQFRLVNGVGRIPADVRKVGTDGGRRHADAAIAILNAHAATAAPAETIAYEGLPKRGLPPGGDRHGFPGDGIMQAMSRAARLLFGADDDRY